MVKMFKMLNGETILGRDEGINEDGYRVVRGVCSLRVQAQPDGSEGVRVMVYMGQKGSDSMAELNPDNIVSRVDMPSELDAAYCQVTTGIVAANAGNLPPPTKQ